MSYLFASFSTKHFITWYYVFGEVDVCTAGVYIFLTNMIMLIKLLQFCNWDLLRWVETTTWMYVCEVVHDLRLIDSFIKLADVCECEKKLRFSANVLVKRICEKRFVYEKKKKKYTTQNKLIKMAFDIEWATLLWPYWKSFGRCRARLMCVPSVFLMAWKKIRNKIKTLIWKLSLNDFYITMKRPRKKRSKIKRKAI